MVPTITSGPKYPKKQILLAITPEMRYSLVANREKIAYITDMNLSDIPLFGIMRSKLSYLSERQSVLAQNIAHSDTPEYKARDINEPDFRKMVSASGLNGNTSLPLAVTSSKHIAKNTPSSALRVEGRNNTYELNPNGNNVVIEEEMSKMAMNQAEYQKVLNLYAKGISMFKIALGKGQP